MRKKYGNANNFLVFAVDKNKGLNYLTRKKPASPTHVYTLLMG